MTYTKHDKQEERMRYIVPSDFFTSDDEKTKLNWFLFEFALELQRFITMDKRIRSKLRIKGISDFQIGKFCIHYAKHMKGQILNRVAHKTENVRIGYEAIEAFFPKLGDRLIDRLLTVVGKAWESQTDACVVCPTRCISEEDEKAPMFDDPTYLD